MKLASSTAHIFFPSFALIIMFHCRANTQTHTKGGNAVGDRDLTSFDGLLALRARFFYSHFHGCLCIGVVFHLFLTLLSFESNESVDDLNI